MHLDTALETLKNTGVLADITLESPLDLAPLRQADSESISSPITLRNCQLMSIIASFTTFEQPVLIENCTLEQGVFMSCYFPAGLVVRNCQVRSEFDLQGGGHNEAEAEIRFEGNTFEDFVNFYDCVFEGPVVLHNNKFLAGSNLLGNTDEPFAVYFEIPPVLSGNEGNIHQSGG